MGQADVDAQAAVDCDTVLRGEFAVKVLDPVADARVG